MARRKKKKKLSLGKVIYASDYPAGADPASLVKTGGLPSALIKKTSTKKSTIPKVTPEESAERMAKGKAYIREREKLASRMGVTSKRAGELLVPKEEAGIVEAKQRETLLETQEAVVERERRKREGITEEAEELPAEELPGVTEPALVGEEAEPKGVFGAIGEVYDFIDTLGGLIPDWEEQGIDIKQGTLPISVGGVGMLGGVKKGKAVINTAKVTTSTRAVKLWKGMREALKKDYVKKIGKWGVIGYGLWSERTMGNIDSALSQVRETLTLPVSLAAVNPNRVEDAYDMITEFEDDINEYERMLKVREPYALTAKISGRTRPIYQRIGKLRLAIDLAREQIAKVEAQGVILSDEETA